ncbi:MAG: hypothetical protein K8L97_26145 [Anaerolineae bacterium]|nr:hypothetical protein [Anaerolineae bacterium]
MSAEDQINSVNWQQIQPPRWANEIPRLLRLMLQSLDYTTRRNTIDTLSNHIAHQSGIYETTIATLPVLLYLLDDPAVNDKEWVLELLYVIRFQNPNLSKLYSQVYEIMLQAQDKISRFLNDANLINRLFAAHILSRFVLHADQSAARLRSRLQIEQDEDVKINVIYCLGELVSHNSSATKATITHILSDLEILAQSPYFYIRCHSLIAYIRIRHDETPDQFIEGLMQCVKEFSTEYDSPVLNAANTSYDICRALAQFSEPRRLNLMTHALSIATSRRMVYSLANELLWSYDFRRKDYVTPISLSEITHNQYRVIQAILSADLFWESGSNVSIEITYKTDLSSRDNLRKQLEQAKVVGD